MVGLVALSCEFVILLGVLSLLISHTTPAGVFQRKVKDSLRSMRLVDQWNSLKAYFDDLGKRGQVQLAKGWQSLKELKEKWRPSIKLPSPDQLWESVKSFFDKVFTGLIFPLLACTCVP